MLTDNGHNGHIWSQIVNLSCKIDSEWFSSVKRYAERHLKWFRSRDMSI